MAEQQSVGRQWVEDEIARRVKNMRRVAVFIDGENFENVFGKYPGMRVNFKKLRKVFARYGDVLSLRSYYAEDCSDGSLERRLNIENRRKFFQVLRGFGFSVHTKTKKVIKNGGKPVVKGDCDIEIAVDIMEVSATNRFDIVILVSGDGDYAYLLERIRRRGIKTIVLASEYNLAMELADACDEILYFRNIADEVLEPWPLAGRSRRSAIVAAQ